MLVLVFWLSCICLLVLSIFFIAIVIHYVWKFKKCSEMRIGIVCRKDNEVSIQYTWGDDKYILQCNDLNSFPDLQDGHRFPVWVNPKHPDKAMLLGFFNINKLLGSIALCILCCLILFLLI